MSSKISDVVEVMQVRNTSHGDFKDNGVIMQALKDTMRMHGKNWHALLPFQKEALDMITHKIGRILSGDPDFADHWLDIEGYARITRERLPGPPIPDDIRVDR